MSDEALSELATRLGAALKGCGLVLATAESCTGGWVGQAVTAISGSSDWYDRGFITYSNHAKQEMLGVSPDTLAQYGAVSEQTAREMAVGALDHSRAQLSLAITGVAGPLGGTPHNPVGTVCFAWAMRDRGAAPDGAGSALAAPTTTTARRRFEGDRDAVRRQAVQFAMQGALELVAGHAPAPPRA